MRISGPNRKTAKGWRNLSKKVFHNLHHSMNIEMIHSKDFSTVRSYELVKTFITNEFQQMKFENSMASKSAVSQPTQSIPNENILAIKSCF
jgi:hypothetical protein